MTSRERYIKIAKFEKPDHVPHCEGVNIRHVLRWQQQGMPQDKTFQEFFDIEPKCTIYRKISYNPIPGHDKLGTIGRFLNALARDHALTARLPEPRKDEDFWVNCTPWGGVKMYAPKHEVLDEWANSAFFDVYGALQSRGDWEAIRDHFEPNADVRFGAEWQEFAEYCKTADQATAIEVPSMVGGIKMFMGFENYCMKLYDDREMIEDVMDRRTELALAMLDRAVDEAPFDFIWFWEDIGFRNGPILSPAIFEEIATPRYKRIADWYKSRGGEIVAVDSDGDVRSLIPGWLKGGINHIWPLEPFAGMDVVALRKEYGQAFSMRGGIDKFCLQRGREGIDRELDRVFPVVRDGGYLPHLDHQIPDCDFDIFCYYMDRKKEMLAAC
jgi:hypothetical protein